MIERYTRKEMGSIWTLENKFREFLNVELAVCRAYSKIGEIPNEILKDIELRDEVDRTREHGAMIPAEDAIIVDNSDETMEQTLERCKKIVLDKMSKREK